MNLWEKAKVWAFKFFGNSLDPVVDYFESIKPDLEKSGLNLSLREYVYIMIFSIFIVFIIEFPALTFILAIFLSSGFAFFLSLTITISLLLGLFFFFYTYPAFLTGRRAKEIEASLPFISIYLSSLTASGVPPVAMFKLLANFKEYKELAREAAKIHQDVEYFGMSLEQAIRKAAMRTPSKEFKEMLLGLLTVLSSGTNLSKFFMEKAKAFMSEYRRRLENYSKILAIFTEMYLTMITVGSIFFIILTVVMSLFSSGNFTSTVLLFQFFVVFFILPGITIGFIFLCRMMSPGV